MRFGMSVPGLHDYPPTSEPWHRQLRAGDWQRIAQTVETAGFDRLTVPEHIVMPIGDVDVMGARWPHGFSAMAFLAGATSRVRVSSGVLVLPYHDPVNLAKSVATVDVLSGGRIDLAIGIGHLQSEFDALGIEFRTRGARTDESLQILKELWTSDRPSFTGRWTTLAGIVFEPKPLQSPHPPLYIGGNSEAALRRAAKYGDGWAPWLIAVAEIPAMLERIRSDPEFDACRPFDVLLPVDVPAVGEDHRIREGASGVRGAQTSGRLVDELLRMHEAGITIAGLPQPIARDLEEYLDELLRFGTEVLAPTRKAAG